MGSGQHRNRRGARPRPAPHKHGGAGNQGRATTQLIPPVMATSAVTGDNPSDRDTDVGAGEPASALPATSDAHGVPAMERDAVSSQDASSHSPAETNHRHHQPGGGHAPQPALVEVEEPLAEETTVEAGATHNPTGAAPAGRGRFERFYTPGQGSRAERVERVAPPISPALPAVVSAPPAPPRRVERSERSERGDHVERPERVERPAIVSEPPLDEDESLEYTGPRSDVRGNVGSLIDSLHEVFTHDRAIASQGGASRCGVCYLHFPVGELIYRDAEGFYVCQSCAHALGSARVPMVRRQQRL